MIVSANMSHSGSKTLNSTPELKEEAKACLKEVHRGLSTYIKENNIMERLISINHEREKLIGELLECEAEIKEAQQEKIQAQQEKIQAQQEKIQAQQEKVHAQQEKIRAQQARMVAQENIKSLENQSAALDVQKALLMQEKQVQSFLAIFHKKDFIDQVSSEKALAFYNKYLKDNNTLTMAQSQNKYFYSLNSMGLVVDYLEAKEELTSCNFLHFNNRVNDILTLGRYLINPECSVKTIAISKNISQESKDILEKIVEKRAGTFKVVYK